MASSINKVILIGNLGADPDLRSTAGGQMVCELRLATNETWKGKDGQKNEKTEWHRVIVWGPQAEACGKYLSKGRSVYVEGRIQTREYTDKDDQKRYITEIVANDVKFLGDGGDKDKEDRPPETPARGPNRRARQPVADLKNPMDEDPDLDGAVDDSQLPF